MKKYSNLTVIYYQRRGFMVNDINNRKCTFWPVYSILPIFYKPACFTVYNDVIVTQTYRRLRLDLSKKAKGASVQCFKEDKGFGVKIARRVCAPLTTGLGSRLHTPD